MWRWLISILICGVLVVSCWAVAWAEEENDEEDDDSEDDEDLQQKVEALEQRVSELEEQLDEDNDEVLSNIPWEPDREGVSLDNGWNISFHGEFRSRALIEANTISGYTNFAGERVYAYHPKSTLSNDYGWWDQRLQFRTIFNFGNYADLIATMQLGDIVWGSQAPVVGGRGDAKFDQASLYFRELYTRIDIYPIPLYLVFGRMPVELGNRLIMGNEHDGAYTYYSHPYFEIGFGSVRQYEGENYEMKMKWNDDEDTFFAWANFVPFENQSLSFFGWLNDFKVTQYPNTPDPESPLYLLPAFSQKAYTGQESQMWNVGANWVGDFGPVTINAEYDQQFGVLNANEDVEEAEDLEWRGWAALLKTDWHITDADTLALTMGYGSGDDPETVHYEGYFAPDNDFGIKEDEMNEYIQRGYFSVYEHLSPGAGVPGGLFDSYGSGGIENTVFANLGLDLNFQANHHYYISYGYIRAAEANPNTDDAEIGWEMDFRTDYIFSRNVVFSIYGGHLFMTGEYFRRRAHDAAQLYFEWKLRW